MLLGPYKVLSDVTSYMCMLVVFITAIEKLKHELVLKLEAKMSGGWANGYRNRGSGRVMVVRGGYGPVPTFKNKKRGGAGLCEFQSGPVPGYRNRGYPFFYPKFYLSLIPIPSRVPTLSLSHSLKLSDLPSTPIPSPTVLPSTPIPSPTVVSPRRIQRDHPCHRQHPREPRPSPLPSILSSSTATPAVVTPSPHHRRDRQRTQAIIPLKFN
ncbi:hypothetical protein DVH24_023351 [Malus domestica]|uniref:Uncharacterized protein n=1 Tax=Malus domestica TaxID=3750 RepID=A0A498KM04_MALDO|nr:hypothetical protein DVH24_023351 [Malus domestica]